MNKSYVNDMNEYEQTLDQYIKGLIRVTRNRSLSLNETLYEEAIDKLHNKHHLLSKEEEEYIIKLANRFV
jgi:hypothetical protein